MSAGSVPLKIDAVMESVSFVAGLTSGARTSLPRAPAIDQRRTPRLGATSVNRASVSDASLEENARL
jgi:hypothetical protein